MKLAALLLLLVLAAAASDEYGSGDAGLGPVEHVPEGKYFHANCSTTNSTFACTSPWQYCDDGVCTCGSTVAHTELHCQVGRNLTVFNYYCVTMNRRDAKTGYSTYLGNCLYQNVHSEGGREETIFPDIPDVLNEFFCGRYFNRTGILCGACKEDHYPLAYSFDVNCVKCSNKILNVFKFAAAVFPPLTLFYFILVLFHINIASSHLHGYVLCCQGMVMPIFSRVLLLRTMEQKQLQLAGRVLGTLFSIWNLDIFRFVKLNICLGTDSLQNLALDLMVGVYPLLLIVVSYILVRFYDNNYKPLVIAWKPFKAFLSLFRGTWEIRTSLIDTFASLFLLSNMKVLNVIFDILTPVYVYQLNSSGKLTHSWRLYFDATVPYFAKRHLPYAVLAIAMLIVFVVTPVLLLILYPFRWFQKLLNLFPFRWYVLHTFMDTFKGCYKDGTEPGTRDCRWFASIFFILRLAIVLVGASTLSLAFYPLASMVLVIVVILLIAAQPYKPHLAHYSSVNATFLLLLAVWYVSLTGIRVAQLKQAHFMGHTFPVFGVFVGAIILLYASAMVLKWMWSQKKFGVTVIKKLHFRRRGYAELQ